MTHDSDDDLPTLRAPERGRRTDDAFSRAVAADVAARRRGRGAFFFAVPAVAAALAVVVVVGRGGGADSAIGDVDDDVVALADFGADFDDDDGSDFAFAELDGSSPRELADIEAALDIALQKNRKL